MAIQEKKVNLHKWVSKWRECDRCNYCAHRCHFCGDDLDHDSYDYDGNLHDVAFCRPDLVKHEPGELCTSPGEWCYWNHENNVLFSYEEVKNGNGLLLSGPGDESND